MRVLDRALERLDARPGKNLRMSGFRQGAEAQNRPVLTSIDNQIPMWTRSPKHFRVSDRTVEAGKRLAAHRKDHCS